MVLLDQSVGIGFKVRKVKTVAGQYRGCFKKYSGVIEKCIKV